MIINTKKNEVGKEDSKCWGGVCNFKHTRGGFTEKLTLE